MNLLKKLAPHGAILIANMYYVFWGIDRVNKSMNFIDNVYTKFLFVLLLIFDAIDLWALLSGFARWTRRRSASGKFLRLGLMGANALFAFVYLILFIVDCFAPNKMLMRKEFVKLWMLVLCLLSTVNGIFQASRNRAAIRQAQVRSARSRQPAASARRTASGGRYSARSGQRSARESFDYPERSTSSSRTARRSVSVGEAYASSGSSRSSASSSSRYASRYDDGYTASTSSRYSSGSSTRRSSRYDDDYTASTSSRSNSGSSSRRSSRYGDDYTTSASSRSSAGSSTRRSSRYDDDFYDSGSARR